MLGKSASVTALVVLAGSLARAADLPAVPFEARVARDTLARSGNGERFYVTNRLKEGDRVVVERIDPSGWAGIQPPSGSFSWIRSQYVQRQGNRGTVTEDNVVVRVGSAFGDEHEVEQIRLFRGDVVEILGEHVLHSDERRIPMLKIRPPKGELRWLPIADIVPLGPIGPRPGGAALPAGTTPAGRSRPATNSPRVPTDPFAIDVSPSDGPHLKDAGREKDTRPVPTRATTPDTTAFQPPLPAEQLPATDTRPATIQADAAARSASESNSSRQRVRTRPVRRDPPRRDPFAEAPIDPLAPERTETSARPSDTGRGAAPLVDGPTGGGLRPQVGAPASGVPSRPASEADPRQDPSASGLRSARQGVSPPSREAPSGSDAPSHQPTSPVTEAAPESRDWLNELQAIDNELNAMLQRSKSQWSFDAFDRRYRTLQAAVPHQSVKRLIELRLRLLEYYREEKRAYDAALAEFRRIVEETDRRNAELARRRASTIPRAARPARSAPAGNGPGTPDGLTGQAAASAPSDRSASAVTRVMKPPAQSPPAGARTTPARGQVQFDGAGILQRSATRYPGAPPYVLLAPNGRILTYLRPDPRINLERYVGRAVGVFGPRRFAPELQADLLDVKGVMPVRLQAD